MFGWPWVSVPIIKADKQIAGDKYGEVLITVKIKKIYCLLYIIATEGFMCDGRVQVIYFWIFYI